MSQDGVQHTFPIEVADRHVIALIDGRRVLVDTGSPATIGECGPMKIGGMQVELRPELGRGRVEAIAAGAGFPLDALLGMDFLARVDVGIHLSERTITFGQELPLKGLILGTTRHQHCEMVQLEASGRTQKVIWDTGAPVSYFADEAISEQRRLGVERDFHPGLDSWNASLWDTVLSLDDKVVRVPAARSSELPTSFREVLRVAGADGILGYRLLEVADIIMSARRQTMAIQIRERPSA